MTDPMRRDGVQCTYDGETHDGALVRSGNSLAFHGVLRRLRMERVETLYSDPSGGKKITMAIMVAISLVAMAFVALPVYLWMLSWLPIGAALWLVIIMLRRDTGWLFIIGDTAGGEERIWRVRDLGPHQDSLWDFLDGIEDHP